MEYQKDTEEAVLSGFFRISTFWTDAPSTNSGDPVMYSPMPLTRQRPFCHQRIARNPSQSWNKMRFDYDESLGYRPSRIPILPTASFETLCLAYRDGRLGQLMDEYGLRNERHQNTSHNSSRCARPNPIPQYGDCLIIWLSNLRI